jgi:hypothetical protein
MPTENILKQSATLPEFLQKVFKCVDSKDFEETPFWDKIEVDPATGKITTMYALFSIAAVPEKYWKDLKPEDSA